MAEFLHNPSVNLRNLAKTMESDIMLGTVSNIFSLDKKETSFKNETQCEIPWNQ